MNIKNKISRVKKQRSELMPGTIVKCESGRFVAFYEHRTDIIANGENEKDAKANLRKMYAVIIKHETKLAKNSVNLPSKFTTKHFKENLECA